jgi:hypothetical protein
MARLNQRPSNVAGKAGVWSAARWKRAVGLWRARLAAAENRKWWTLAVV